MLSSLREAKDLHKSAKLFVDLYGMNDLCLAGIFALAAADALGFVDNGGNVLDDADGSYGTSVNAHKAKLASASDLVNFFHGSSSILIYASIIPRTAAFVNTE